MLIDWILFLFAVVVGGVLFGFSALNISSIFRDSGGPSHDTTKDTESPAFSVPASGLEHKQNLNSCKTWRPTTKSKPEWRGIWQTTERKEPSESISSKKNLGDNSKGCRESQVHLYLCSSLSKATVQIVKVDELQISVWTVGRRTGALGSYYGSPIKPLCLTFGWF